MPLESAVGLILRSYEEWLVKDGDPATGTSVSDQSETGRHAPSSSFKPPDDNISRMLQMVIDGRCLVVEELDEVIDYFQQQRNVMAKAQGILPASESVQPGFCVLCMPE